MFNVQVVDSLESFLQAQAFYFQEWEGEPMSDEDSPPRLIPTKRPQYGAWFGCVA